MTLPYGVSADAYFETFDAGLSWTQTITRPNAGWAYGFNLLEVPGHNAIFYTYISSAYPQMLGDSLKNANFYVYSGNDITTNITLQGSILYGIRSNKLCISDDYGLNWTTAQVPSAFGSLSGVTFLDPLNGVIIEYGNLSCNRTKDGGKTWTRYVHEGSDGFRLVYPKSKNECYLLGNKGRLFHTTTGGDSWSFQDLNGDLQQMQFVTPDTGYISGKYNLFRTFDAGQHWEKLNFIGSGYYLNFVTPDIGYTGGIERTTDAGTTWTDVSVTDDFNYFNYGGAGGCFRSPTEGLIAAQNSLLWTKDGCTSYQDTATGVTGQISALNNGNWLVVNKIGNIFLCDKDLHCSTKYYDNKYDYVSYGNLLRPDSATLMFSPIVAHVIINKVGTFVSMKDTVIISKDGGNTWTKTYYPTVGTQLSFGDSHTLYSINQGIFRGVIQTPTTISQLIQTANRTLSCTVVNDDKSSFPATVVLLRNDSVYYQSSVVIESGTSFTINILASIAAGTGYSIKIIPTDSTQYTTAESSVFAITTGIAELNNSHIIRVVGNSILCDCKDFIVYNYLGQKLYPTNLPVGIYFVKVGDSVQKVLVKQ